MILQELWLHKLEWDESIPMSLATSWDNFKENIKRIPEIRIPRFVNILSSSKIQVHGFADASMRAYGCCIYIRSGYKNNYKSILLTAKSKVAPLKTKTLPRLELCAVHLLAKLWKNIAPILLPNTEKTVFWTDSEIVLYWLKKHPSTLSVFVGNRVADVQEWTENVIWKHVPTAHNPADIASRSCTVDEMRQSIWFNGPRFLTQGEDNWPNNPHFKPPEDMENLEIRKAKPLVLLSSKKSCIINTLIENCSTYLKIVRILAYVYRFLSPTEKEPQITAKELEMSFLKIVEVIQHEEFENEIKCLKNSSSVNKQIQKLNPFVQDCNEGNRNFTLLRVYRKERLAAQGRLRQRNKFRGSQCQDEGTSRRIFQRGQQKAD
ncbi:uncharacterized protein LOC118749914, partial [Rhagoletis pomonella]|uniref:uncharacterized protein LOC118749914 n=1 Tax=Rhagoletis pomonella TaxID=28610 RepID=UPI0017868592